MWVWGRDTRSGATMAPDTELSAAARSLIRAGRQQAASPQVRARILSQMLQARQRSRHRRWFASLLLPAAAAVVALLVWRWDLRKAEAPLIRAEAPVRAPVHPSAATPPLAPGSEPPRPRPSPPPSERPRSGVPTPKPRSKPPSQRSLAQEVAQLDQVSAKLGSGDTDAALRLLEDYEHGSAPRLSAEATLLKIEALARAGRTDEARAIAKNFVARYPDSPLVDRARAYLGEPKP